MPSLVDIQIDEWSEPLFVVLDAVCEVDIFGPKLGFGEQAFKIAIREAAQAVGGWRLVGATLYVTQEPCPMCAGAIVNARVERVVFGCDNPKAGAVKTLYRLLEDERLNHRVTVEQSPLAPECGELLRRFFGELRKL